MFTFSKYLLYSNKELNKYLLKFSTFFSVDQKSCVG